MFKLPIKSDPVLFCQVDVDKFELITKCGEDFTTFRRFYGWVTGKINFLFNILLIIINVALFLLSFSLFFDRVISPETHTIAINPLKIFVPFISFGLFTWWCGKDKKDGFTITNSSTWTTKSWVTREYK